MDECRHGLIAAVCAVCCRATTQAELGASASQAPAPQQQELVIAGGAVPR
jgi:hypothetical protein